MSLADLGHVLLPAHSHQASIIEAPSDWDPSALLNLTHGDPVVWGRAPLAAGAGPATLLRHAWHRERALNRLRRTHRYRIQRWAPGRLRNGVVRNQIRSMARSGAIVERQSDIIRLVDDVSDAAGIEHRVIGFRPATGGVLHARVRLADDVPALLKVARDGGPNGVAREAEALQVLEEAGVEHVPRLLGAGTTAGAVWTLQQVLPGERPGGVRSSLAGSIGRFCAQLPHTADASRSVRADARAIGQVLPDHQTAVEAISDHTTHRLAAVPGVLRHGDLWSANLLTSGGHLSGVVDWDAWDESGAPGCDLLHLTTREHATRRARSLGAVFAERPWEWPSFRRISAPYWRSLAIDPDPRLLEAVGWAWWLNQIAGSLHRLPHRAHDQRWLTENVISVLDSHRRTGTV